MILQGYVFSFRTFHTSVHGRTQSILLRLEGTDPHTLENALGPLGVWPVNP